MAPAVMTMVTALGCARPAPQADTRADVAAINEVRDREIEFVRTGDVNGLLTVYTDDVVMMPPNEPAVHGKDTVREWGEAMFGQVTIAGQYTSSEVSVSGDWAVDRYAGVLTMTPKAGGSPTEEKIKGVHILKRQPDGAWRIAQDVWNSDEPLPSGPAPAPTK